MKRIVPVAVALALLATLVLGAMPIGATFPGENGKIAYVLTAAGGDFPHIWVMDADGTNARQWIADETTGSLCPSWSPNGAQMAYMYTPDGSGDNYEIWIADADGSNPRQLISSEGSNAFPVWSPDGSKIAYWSDRGGQPQLYVIDADGSNETALPGATMVIDSIEFYEYFSYRQSWSPDGSKIAYMVGDGKDVQCYVTNADGSGAPWPLIDDDSVEILFPTWSPDGSKILFFSNADGNYDIYTMNTDDTGEPNNLTNSEDDEDINAFPRWSPDGSKIAFLSNRENGGQLWVMNADGSNPSRLTDSAGFHLESSFTWSPDSRELVFDTQFDGHSDIYVINADGTSEPANRTGNQEGYCLYPQWQPIVVAPTPTPTPTPTPPEVPEPGTMMLLASGLAGLGGLTAFRARFRR